MPTNWNEFVASAPALEAAGKIPLALGNQPWQSNLAFGAMTVAVAGLDVWKHDWRDTKERVHVRDPLYHQDFTFHVYEIGSADRVVTFAAGEFSNCMWGFYVRRRVDA